MTKKFDFTYGDVSCYGCNRSLTDEEIEWIDNDGKDLNVSFECEECGVNTQIYQNLREE